MLNLDLNQKRVLLVFGTILVLLVTGYILKDVFADNVRPAAARGEQDIVVVSQLEDGGQGGQDKVSQPVSKEGVINQPVKKIKVYIVGAVRYPGVIEVEEGSRLIDVLELAGGATEEADLERVNLALKVQDEGMYKIPKKGEELMVPDPNVSNTTSGIASGKGQQKVNINTADEAMLDTLPGIGPSKAKRIIEYREQNGPFKSIEEIKNVSGIGEKTFEQIKDLITVN
ncbi:competence protein ComEA [Caldicoprobacter guelmensis]|uniref:helix-hairpin-helix domain-containing protein n=1 Tax=Caldicoprobacter guelmensis TaxID=1170224 RepID=UPI001956B58D|nr:helix-hairpin-helix domain-containing protein [Caldicoprobacter guelmensis]MBM7582663.1 competence protein ComEA [Caldicoprobacter guelmensis]